MYGRRTRRFYGYRRVGYGRGAFRSRRFGYRRRRW